MGRLRFHPRGRFATSTNLGDGSEAARLVGSQMDWTSDRPLTHPGAQGITSELVAGLQKNFFIRRRRRVVFVCGGSTDPKSPSHRSEFLNWAEANVGSEALLLRAEVAYGAATERGKKFI